MCIAIIGAGGIGGYIGARLAQAGGDVSFIAARYGQPDCQDSLDGPVLPVPTLRAAVRIVERNTPHRAVVLDSSRPWISSMRCCVTQGSRMLSSRPRRSG
ncbi:MAG: hypothetical protein E5X68_31880 [Mesorhizobium sp.]|nr:MAG: hypothetical protein EOQ84_21940 [Mesorhizobium sp.]RWL27784.1 MAG: hypothetical protein EOR58_14015 [Mesorhizobium sp.]RWL29092.1 MAG: hypothetical protein EOR63_19130 [Mesorhizobium sp.]RWL34788.1 MAG: hypothetical protein EOR59_23705 [Mesorhizobium sp.]RWL45711.1 MAG: hypothetical protein EOR61_28450 [Mesorhizobium sp.]